MLKVEEKRAIGQCIAAGISEAERIERMWASEVRERGLEREMEELASQISDKDRRLMDLYSDHAADGFDCYEEFNQVTMKLISYLGKRAQAARLSILLEEKGIHFDLSSTEIPNLDDITRRYLFKKSRPDK
jgi:hypothetical protein